MGLTDGNVIFDILEAPAFQKYSICWVFQAFFCSTSFYMYFATQPSPSLLVEQQCNGCMTSQVGVRRDGNHKHTTKEENIHMLFIRLVITIIMMAINILGSSMKHTLVGSCQYRSGSIGKGPFIYQYNLYNLGVLADLVEHSHSESDPLTPQKAFVHGGGKFHLQSGK